MDWIYGKTVLITGASSGLGRAMAVRLIKEHNCKVIGIGQSEPKMKSLIDELSYQKDAFTYQLFDVGVKKNWEIFSDKILANNINIDILINNAAVDLSNLFHLKNAEEFRKTLDVNVVGAYNCSKSVSAHMLKQDYGRIINISSTNGMNTYYPMCIDYDASKAALISLTHNLAFEFGPYIHVNCIAPGFIGTENELDGYDEEFLKEEQEKIMVKRYGKPEEVAYLVKFLISDEANFINNSIIRIDGGQIGSM